MHRKQPQVIQSEQKKSKVGCQRRQSGFHTPGLRSSREQSLSSSSMKVKCNTDHKRTSRRSVLSPRTSTCPQRPLSRMSKDIERPGKIQTATGTTTVWVNLQSGLKYYFIKSLGLFLGSWGFIIFFIPISQKHPPIIRIRIMRIIHLRIAFTNSELHTFYERPLQKYPRKDGMSVWGKSLKRWPLTAPWKIDIILELLSHIPKSAPDADIMQIIAVHRKKADYSAPVPIFDQIMQIISALLNLWKGYQLLSAHFAFWHVGQHPPPPPPPGHSHTNLLPTRVHQPIKWTLNGVLHHFTFAPLYKTNCLKEELHTRILKNLKEREKYSLQNSAKMMKIG